MELTGDVGRRESGRILESVEIEKSEGKVPGEDACDEIVCCVVGSIRHA